MIDRSCIIMHTTGIDAHTCVPWSGMMVKRITSYSRRIQHTLPSDDSDAVSSDLVSIDPLFYRLILLEKVLLSLNCVRKRIVRVDDGGKRIDCN